MLWESPYRDHMEKSWDKGKRDAYAAPKFSSIPMPTDSALATIWLQPYEKP